MIVGYVGQSDDRDSRLAALERYAVERGEPFEAMPWAGDDVFDEAAREALNGQLGEVHAAFVNVPPAYTFEVGQLALRRGVHLFLEWAAMPSLAECDELARLAEEAGVEAGVSRPLRFHPLLNGWLEGGHAALVDIRHAMQGAESSFFQRMVEDAVDLCRRFAGDSDVRKVEARIVRSGPARPDALLVGLRFQNGAYAHVQIRRHAPFPEHIVHASGPGFQVDANLLDRVGYVPGTDIEQNATRDVAFEERRWPASDLIERETRAFLEALARGEPAPVSLMEGYRTLQLVEAIWKSLR